MTGDLTLTPTEDWHVAHVAMHMRAADRAEVMAHSGRLPDASLIYSIQRSEFAWTAFINGLPVAIFGCGGAEYDQTIGCVWMLSTDEAERNRRTLLAVSPDLVRQLLARYRYIGGHVHLSNTRTIRWLEWLGFRFNEPELINGEPFLCFWKGADDVRTDDNACNRIDRHGRRRRNPARQSGGGISEL